MNPTQRTYIAIDLKSFFASVECVERGLDPLTTNLVVADASRTEKTICLAVTPSLKAYGVGGRARLFEVVQRVREVNRQRWYRSFSHRLSGKSCDARALEQHPDWEVDYIVAPPRMAYYIEYSRRIYEIYLKYIAPEDIHVYSIDEVFIDVTSYLLTYRMTAHELAMTMIRHVLKQTGITATAGIGTNLYLCKIAMDIVAKHRGGFYRFSYDITSLLKYGAANKLEVRVKKHSGNKSVNAAERKADWWLFGGIYRPVWLEAKPQIRIEHIAVDAKMDGEMQLYTELKGVKGKEKLTAALHPLDGTDVCSEVRMWEVGHDSVFAHIWKNVEPWTPEKPRLYNLIVTLRNEEGEALHRTSVRVGFRTVDFRPRDGVYLNGTKLVMKGINRHSFHPDGGRTTNKELSIQDALLIKEMNMNAVRSHYPPDEHFLDACDSLGLLYIDELAGWQNAYDTVTGSKLVKEMIARDVNHPCIVLWSNGNEGGWNIATDKLFYRYDPQRRHVIHPWADFDELDTHHYPAYLTGVGRFTNGYKVFMPTEFMHGLYDQGHGAGLEDFWARYTAHPLFAGGFLWAYSDEAVRRTDCNGILDSEDYNAPDGIVGPYREKEGSFYSVREIWSPIKIKPLQLTPSFNGRFLVENRYLFTNLKECSMRYRVLSYPSPLQSRAEGCTVDSGRVNLPALEPGETGYACIAAWENPEIREKFFSKGDVLELEAIGLDGKSVCTRTYPISFAKSYFEGQLASLKRTGKGCCVNEADSLITLCSDWVDISFRRNDATIYSVLRKKDNRIIPLKDGPLPVGMQMKLVSLSARMEQRGDAVLCARYRGGADSVVWRLRPDGLLKMDAVLLNRASGGGGFDDAFTDNAILNFGFTFSYPESECTGMR